VEVEIEGRFTTLPKCFPDGIWRGRILFSFDFDLSKAFAQQEHYLTQSWYALWASSTL
jgi:hypothetical protein